MSDTIKSLYEQGQNAYFSGKSISDCSYKLHWKQKAWQDGFKSAQSEAKPENVGKKENIKKGVNLLRSVLKG